MKSSFQLSIVSILSLAATSLACHAVEDVKITFYGPPDNDPPGDATAYSCLGRGYHAGGTGTYADPLTFASAPGEFSACQIIWAPYLDKYLIMQDTCAQCETDWDNGEYHIDIWAGAAGTISCEDALTPDGLQSIVTSPATTYTVDTTVLDNGVCNSGDTKPGNAATKWCSS